MYKTAVYTLVNGSITNDGHRLLGM